MFRHFLLAFFRLLHMAVSKNSGTSTPKSSILIGFSIINHPFWCTTIFGNTHMKSCWKHLRITESTGVSSFKAPASRFRFHVHLWKGIHTFFGGKLTKNGNNLGTLSGIWRWQVSSRNCLFSKKGVPSGGIHWVFKAMKCQTQESLNRSTERFNSTVRMLWKL